jgi:hypothetical protein
MNTQHPSKFGDRTLINKNKKLAREAAEAEEAAQTGDKLYHVQVNYSVWIAENDSETVKVWASNEVEAEELASDRFLEDFDDDGDDLEVDSTKIIKVEEHKDLKTIDMFKKC